MRKDTLLPLPAPKPLPQHAQPSSPSRTFAPAMQKQFIADPFAKRGNVLLLVVKGVVLLSSADRRCVSVRICLHGKDLLLFQTKFKSASC